MPAARCAILAPVFVVPTNPTDRDTRVARDLVADLVARAGHEVEDAGREVRLEDRLRQRDGALAGQTGGVPDDGVAGGERGRDQLRGHRVRPVPGVITPTTPFGTR